jgi:hypothetical protein
MDFKASDLWSSSKGSFKKMIITSNRILRHKNLASPSLLPLYRTARPGRISQMKMLGLSRMTRRSSATDSRTRRRVIWKSSLPWKLNKKMFQYLNHHFAPCGDQKCSIIKEI